MHNKRIFRQLAAVLVVAALVIGLWLALTDSETVAPDNPLDHFSEDSSHRLQQEPLTVDSESLQAPEDNLASASPDPTAETSPTPEATQRATESPTQSPAQDPTESPTQRTDSSNSTQLDPLVTPAPEQGIDAEPTAGVGDATTSTSVVYFTTSIINGSTISAKELEFTITHKQASLAVRSTTVEVNGSEIVQFNGRVQLIEGQNSIKVTVVYADPSGKQLQVSKTYTVFVVPDELIITTDLSDRTVNQRSFSFTAYASLGSRKAALTVTVNGETLDSASNRYKTTLNEGENTITLAASGEGQLLEQSYTVTVELPEDIEIITDLYEHEVDDPAFTFHASIIGGTERAELTVVANGVTLTGDGDQYACVLSRGNNLIRLKASDVDGKEYTQSYTVAYHHYVISEAADADETMPKMTCNLTDGMSISGSLYTLQVSAKTGTGERIYGDHISVQLNGRTLEDMWEDEQRTGYRLELSGGKNDVVITVWDYEDRYTIYRYTVNCAVVEEGSRKGTVTVIVDANVIGLGQLMSTSVDLFEGQNAVYPVAQALEANGFEYQYSGNLTNGFYLAHLLKTGITNGWAIPEALEDLINEDGLMWTNSYHTDSLGEFDFTQGSGWMYSVNDVYPNYSLSECYLQDGDVVRLRFTLAYGKDVGAGSAQGNGDNYDQQW